MQKRLRIFLILFFFIANGLNEEVKNKKEEASSISPNFELDENVYVLTETNFDLFLKENPTTLIEFYAPWYVINLIN